jgi:hypothetical protein
MSSKIAGAIIVASLALFCARNADAAIVTLEWDPPVDTVTTGYIVLYGNTPGSYAFQVDTGLTTRFAVHGLADGVTYYFAVLAYDTAGLVSDVSPEISTTTASVITGLTLTSSLPSPQMVGTTMTWNATATGGSAPHEFQWALHQNGQWTVAPWATASTWTWRPAAVSTDAQVRVAVRNAGSTSNSGDLDRAVPFVVTALAVIPTSTPYSGQPVSLPGTVQAENFDHGGANVAYHDSTGSSGNKYRTTDVDLQATTDSGGGYNVRSTTAGEWLNYAVHVQAAGSYRLELRVASSSTGGRLHVEFGGVDVTGLLTIPNTGGWQTWTTISVPVTLAAGSQHLRLVMDAASSSGVVGNVNFMRVVADSASASTIVIYGSDVPDAALRGMWSKGSDATSPNGVKLQTPDTGVLYADSPLAAPIHYFDVTITPLADTPYTIWLRLKARGNKHFNDAVWVQFSNARVNGAPVYAINTTSGLLVNLASTATAASLRKWGWENGAYWLSQPTTLTFPGGPQTLRIQVREDGVEIDQIVLSPTTYLKVAPGGRTDDHTIVPK